MVAQATVNRKVGGSNPPGGAKFEICRTEMAQCYDLESFEVKFGGEN